MGGFLQSGLFSLQSPTEARKRSNSPMQRDATCLTIFTILSVRASQPSLERRVGIGRLGFHEVMRSQLAVCLAAFAHLTPVVHAQSLDNNAVTSVSSEPHAQRRLNFEPAEKQAKLG